jgi:signal transduction histidine kinase
MTVIRGYIEILLQGNFGELNDTQSDFLHKMLRSVKDLISFVNDTLDLSKIQSGTLQLHIESQSVDAILSNVTDNLQELFDEAKVRLVFSSAGYNVLADQSQFNRVLTNLLSNALKFTPPGGLVSVESRLEGDTVVIEVKDDGIGMNIDDKTVLFQKYAQIENRWVSKMRGTGLGLVISKDLVERMGGKIWVESELDKGSTFFVALPLATSSESTIK